MASTRIKLSAQFFIRAYQKYNIRYLINLPPVAVRYDDRECTRPRSTPLLGAASGVDIGQLLGQAVGGGAGAIVAVIVGLINKPRYAKMASLSVFGVGRQQFGRTRITIIPGRVICHIGNGQLPLCKQVARIHGAGQAIEKSGRIFRLRT